MPILHASVSLQGQGHVLEAVQENWSNENTIGSSPSQSLMDCLIAVHMIGSRLKMKGCFLR